jgi:hypothetical protein
VHRQKSRLEIILNKTSGLVNEKINITGHQAGLFPKTASMSSLKMTSFSSSSSAIFPRELLCSIKIFFDLW